MNIACAYPNCQNPVIGQCVGQNGKLCKRYYCHPHSTGNMCYKCADEKTSKEEYLYIAQEFARISERILMKGKKKFWSYYWNRLIAIGLIVILLLFFLHQFILTYLPKFEDAFLSILYIFMIVGGLILAVELRNRIFRYEVKLAEEVAEEFRAKKLDFVRFFKNYRSEKEGTQTQRALKVVGAIGLITLGIAVGLSREAYRQEFLADVKGINRKLERL